MSSSYIYTMYKLSRTHPPDKTVLKDINLSFYPGAKIGVRGHHGSGPPSMPVNASGVSKPPCGPSQELTGSYHSSSDCAFSATPPPEAVMDGIPRPMGTFASVLPATGIGGF